MNKLDEMNELVLSVEQILENMKAIRDKPEEPKLFDELTEEQWQIVIDEKLVCIFWDEKIKTLTNIGYLYARSALEEFKFIKEDSCGWEHCELHPSQPQFCNGTRPEGLYDDERLAIKYNYVSSIAFRPASGIDWSLVKRWQRVKV